MARSVARWTVGAALGAAGVAAGCQIVAGLNDPLTGPAEAGVPTGDDAAAEASGDGSNPPPDASPDAGADSGCPVTGGGPAMVNVGPFCIDSTEVTNAQYNAFVQADASLTLQPATCSFNPNYVPLNPNGWPYSAGQDSYPVVYVNWCMAYAFCAWTGKRLCGAIGGGPAPFGNFTAFNNQFYYACSNNGAQDFPYGPTYQAGNCNDGNYDAGSAGPNATPVGSLPGCMGAAPGIYDMVGNVEEWQDACQSATGASDTCFEGNGSFSFPDTDGGIGPGCDFADTGNRGDTNPNVGFRCCAP